MSQAAKVQQQGISTAEAIELNDGERPKCDCHAEPMQWSKNATKPRGGHWYCHVKHRERRQDAKAAAAPGPAWIEDPSRPEPNTYVATADLAPFVEQAIEASGVMVFAARVAHFDPSLSDADTASRSLRRILSLDNALTTTQRADAILVAAGLCISQEPIPILPGGQTAAELSVHVHHDLRGEELTGAERIRLAKQLASFARGYVAGLTDTVDELIEQKTREEAAA